MEQMGEKKGLNGGQELEAKKSSKAILEQAMIDGLRQLARPTGGLFISGLSAGLDVGFSLFLMAVMMTLAQGTLSKAVTDLLVANMYSIGFIFVIMGRSELFTEQTTTAVLPVLHRRASLGQLGRLWGLVYLSNIIGGTIFAALAAQIGPRMGVIDTAAIGQIARGLVEHGSVVILCSAILAGWMMGLLTWLIAAARDTISQVFFVWLITTAIGVSHLHHSVAGTVEVMAGVFARQGITLPDYAHFITWTSLGNALGAVCFVAIMKYSHVIRSGAEPEPVHLDEPGPAQRILGIE